MKYEIKDVLRSEITSQCKKACTVENVETLNETVSQLGCFDGITVNVIKK